MTHQPLFPNPRTIAQAIGNEFIDGTSWTTPRGVSMTELIELHSGCIEHRDGSPWEWRAVFWDRSVITACAGAWDIGFPDCWCWDGNGHENCTAGEG